MKPHRPYTLQEYDPRWKGRFSEAAAILRPILGDNLVAIEHIGSTSIEGMVAKPQVDVLVVVKHLDRVKEHYNDFVRTGFTPRGRGYVNDDDEYITQDAPDGARLTSVHVLEAGNPRIAEYKNFRDYLRENKKDRDLYIATKQQAYISHHNNYAEYEQSKKGVINAIIARSKQWATQSL